MTVKGQAQQCEVIKGSSTRNLLLFFLCESPLTAVGEVRFDGRVEENQTPNEKCEGMNSSPEIRRSPHPSSSQTHKTNK